MRLKFFYHSHYLSIFSLVILAIFILGGFYLFFTNKTNKIPLGFYKGVRFSINASENDLTEAKNWGANIIDIGLNVFPEENGRWRLGDSLKGEGKKDWQKIMTGLVKVARKNGLQITLTSFFYPELYTREPQAWLDHAKPLYQEIGEFAANNNIYLVFVPGEIEVATGATCCSQDPSADFTPTANNELSAKGFSYWSSKISHELKDELRKNFQGFIGADYIAGNWWYEGERFVGFPPWKMEGFHILRSGIAKDSPDFDTNPSQTSFNYARVIKDVAQKSGVEKVISFGPLSNSRERIHGKDFLFTEEKRRSYYQIFFEQTHQSLDGYVLQKFPPPLYDPAVIEIAKEWFKKL